MAYVTKFYVNHILDDKGGIVGYEIEDYSDPLRHWIHYYYQMATVGIWGGMK